MVVGAFSLALGSLLSSAIACWILNDGYSKVYFDVAEHGYVWFVLQIPIVFIGQDYIIYWSHRIFHLPFLYKNFHKLHHTYKQPTAFSATAIHPVEFLFFQFVYISPMFIFTVHFGNFIQYILVITLAHFLGFEFLVRNEENILLSHEKRGKFEESLNSLYLPNFKFYCILI